MSAKDDVMDELLAAIRRKPAIYLGEVSLSRLWLFSEGYRIALAQHDIPHESIAWNIPFLRHVARHTDKQPVGPRSYPQMILPHVGGDEVRALELFWQLLDEFRALERAPEIER